MFQTIYKLTQKSKYRPMIVSGDGENTLAWTNLDGVLNLSRVPSTVHGFKDSPTIFTSSGGPSFLLMGHSNSGYLFWCEKEKDDGGYQILFTTVKKGMGAIKYDVSKDSQKVNSAVSSDGILSATLTTQNGQLVINLGWRDPKGHLCFTQIQPLKIMSGGSLEFRFDEKANAGPCLAMMGGRPVLSYFDDNKHLCIARAPKNTIKFDFKNKLVFKDISSKFAPFIVPQAPGVGYVFWVSASDGTLNYHQIGIDAKGEIVMSAHEEGSGTIKEALPNSAPSARMIFLEKDGHHKSQLQVVWSQASDDRICVAEFDAHVAALS